MIESIICHVPSLHVGKCLQFMYYGMNTVSIFFAGGRWSPVAGGWSGRKTNKASTNPTRLFSSRKYSRRIFENRRG